MSYTPHILSVEQMYEADRRAIEGGVAGIILMENAGQGIAAHMEKGWDKCTVLVLCGPGNNGGDGYVVARALSEAGWPVQVAAYGDPKSLKGDAYAMYEKYEGDVGGWSDIDLDDVDLVVDGIFGAGFRGDLPAEMVDVFDEITACEIPVVAIDVPSGMNGSTGDASEGTLFCDLTVSFFRPKTGHLLYPGRSHTGLLEIVDIGIPDTVLEVIDIETFENDEELWLDAMPQMQETAHKYDRGHAAVVGGGMSSTGAAKIASKTALRSGAGAVTVVTPPSALMSYSIALEAVMVKAVESAEDFGAWLTTKRIAAVLIGPGNGVHDRTRSFVETALSLECVVVLDADALTAFADSASDLFDLIGNKTGGPVILTPHEAEFKRLFDIEGSAIERCRFAANQSGAIVLLKGASTVIAEPKGRLVVNTNAPQWLATAGSGDALAGIITGLAAASDDFFSMVCAAAWIHGETGNRFGPGLIAEDMSHIIPSILSDIYTQIADEKD